jgi:hypothetical protein
VEVKAHPAIISSSASGMGVGVGSKSALSAWESVRLRRSTWPDLWVRVFASDRKRPLVARANCTLIAQQGKVAATMSYILHAMDTPSSGS